MKIDWRVQDEEAGAGDVGGPGDGAPSDAVGEQSAAPNAMEADETQALVDQFRKFEADSDAEPSEPAPAEPAAPEGKAAPAAPAAETAAAPDQRAMIAQLAQQVGIDPREFENFQTIDEVRRAVDLTTRQLQRMLYEASQQQVEQTPVAPAGFDARQASAAVGQTPVPPIDWGEGGRESWDPHAARMFEQMHAGLHAERSNREAMHAELQQFRAWREQVETESRSRAHEDIKRSVDEAIEALGDAELYGTGDYFKLTPAQQQAREQVVRFCQNELASAFSRNNRPSVKSLLEAAHRGLYFDRVMAAKEKARAEQARHQSQKRLGSPGRPPQQRPPESADYDYRTADPDLVGKLAESLARLDE